MDQTLLDRTEEFCRTIAKWYQFCSVCSYDAKLRQSIEETALSLRIPLNELVVQSPSDYSTEVYAFDVNFARRKLAGSDDARIASFLKMLQRANLNESLCDSQLYCMQSFRQLLHTLLLRHVKGQLLLKPPSGSGEMVVSVVQACFKSLVSGMRDSTHVSWMMRESALFLLLVLKLVDDSMWDQLDSKECLLLASRSIPFAISKRVRTPSFLESLLAAILKIVRASDRRTSATQSQKPTSSTEVSLILVSMLGEVIPACFENSFMDTSPMDGAESDPLVLKNLVFSLVSETLRVSVNSSQLVPVIVRIEMKCFCDGVLMILASLRPIQAY